MSTTTEGALTFADLLARLVDISLMRIRLRSAPGDASEHDLFEVPLADLFHLSK